MIKKKLKTGLWLFLSLLYLLGQLIPVAALEPATIHVEYPMGLIGPDPNQKWAIGLTRPHASGYSYEFYADMSIQGQKVYCLKPLANISDGVGGYTALDLSTYFGNEALTQKLEWISALGFGFENDRSPEMDFATQLRIWQEISPGLITNIHPQIQEKIDRINERLKVMESNVSFEKEAVTVYGYGKEFAQTLTDTHHVLEHSIVKGTNVEWEHNGNTLKVWMNPGTHQQGQLSLHTYYTPQGTSIAYRNPYGYQDVGYITGGAGKQSHLDVKVRLGSVQIKKQDEETGERAQGEATLAGARYELIDDKTGQKKGVLTVQDNLISNRIENLPSDRTYSLKEIQAPKGYLINKNVLTADVLHHPQIQLDVKDHVITGQVELRKIITDAHNSEIVQVEKGAVFGVVLQRYVEQYGSVKEALKHTDTYANREWDRLVTDENGNARSKELAYGTYVIAQLKGQSETDLLKETFTFTVDRPDNRPVSYTINNRPSDYYLRLIKKDSDTKEVITYSGARFQIYDEKGKKVTMKLGAKTVDTFMTSSQQNKVPVGTFVASDEKGMVITPLKLKAGRYRIEEIEAPQGYLLEKEPIWVDIQKSHVVSEDEDRDAYIDVEIMDKKPTGTLELKKEFENLSDETCHRPVRFRLSAGADILNPANGEVLYHAGDPVSVNGAQEGIYELGKDSILRISGLPLGLEQSVYHLEEIETLEGYLLPEAGMDFVFKKADDHTLTYVVCKNLKNKKMHLTTQVQGTKVFDSNQKMWIRDVVNYHQLDSHKTYRLEGTIVDKRTGKPVVIQNKIVRHDLTFVPDPEHPYIENIFVLDAHTLPQGEYVIYEKLYCDQGHLLAFHEDLHDAAQSFQVLPLYVVEVKKVDAQTNKVILNQPFSFSLRKKEKTEMDIKNVKPMWNQGIVSFSGVSNGIWLLQEKSAPEGYMLDTHVYQLRIQGENVWLDGKPVKIKDGIIQISISNRKKKPVLTGVLFGFSSGLLWFGLSGLLLILIFVLQLWRKKSL